MAALDGKQKIRPTAFDAHEQLTRAPHTHSAATGYAAAEFKQQNYPKHLGEIDGVAVVAKDAKEEIEKAKLVDAAKKAKEAK